MLDFGSSGLPFRSLGQVWGTWGELFGFLGLFFECFFRSISGAVGQQGASGSGALDGGGSLRVTLVRVYRKEISYA